MPEVDKIPTLDRDSAEYLSDRQMGTLSDMVSQFEYSDDSTQINYQGRPVTASTRTAPMMSVPPKRPMVLAIRGATW